MVIYIMVRLYYFHDHCIFLCFIFKFLLHLFEGINNISKIKCFLKKPIKKLKDLQQSDVLIHFCQKFTFSQKKIPHTNPQLSNYYPSQVFHFYIVNKYKQIVPMYSFVLLKKIQLMKKKNYNIQGIKNIYNCTCSLM